MALVLRYEPNGTMHDDVVLSDGPQEWRCDSYHMAIHDTMPSGREDVGKVRMVRHRLLQQWRHGIDHVEIGETVYLPFDFSDQCTAFLRCRRRDDRFGVVTGWSSIEGHCISPADIGEHVHRVPDFKPEGPGITMTRNELLDAIDESVNALL